MSGFYIQPSASASTSSHVSGPTASGRTSLEVSDNDPDLPFPTPLPRAAFLDPDFTPSALLSTLTPRTRHQTLEDLRSELRGRSALLSRELLDLVNSHYADFVALGSALKGGDEKVEEVRVSLLALRREIERVREQVSEREQEIRLLVAEREVARRELEKGRELLRWLERVEVLEARLRISNDAGYALSIEAETNGEFEDCSLGGLHINDDDSDLEEDDPDEDEAGTTSTVSLARLTRRADEYREIVKQAQSLGTAHPLVKNEWPRVQRLKDTLLLDLNTVVRESRDAGTSRTDLLLKTLVLYGTVGAEKLAIEVFKGAKNNGTGNLNAQRPI